MKWFRKKKCYHVYDIIWSWYPIEFQRCVHSKCKSVRVFDQENAVILTEVDGDNVINIDLKQGRFNAKS